MRSFSFRNVAKSLQLITLISVSSVILLSCGGGSSGGGGSEAKVAPSSLDGVKLDLFGAFSLRFFRLGGTSGNENGGADYDMIKDEFRVATSDGSGSLGLDYRIPVTLQDVSYTYNRTSATTGRITITYFNDQIYPFNATDATSSTKQVGPFGDLFWGGPNRIQDDLVLDVLFSDSGGATITDTTVRVRSVYRYDSTFSGSGPAFSRTSSNEFDTTTARFTLISGGLLPSGYDPEVDPNAPASAVFTGIQAKTIDFFGSDVTRRIAHQSSSTPVVQIPGESSSSIEDSGNILVDVFGESVRGGSGQYSYTRTGGSGAKLAIRYTRPNGTTDETVNVVYTLTFTSIDGGTFIDSNGATGTFRQDQFTNT